VQAIFALALMMMIMLPIFLCDNPWPVSARDLLVREGAQESGASNLVSAIYLGYRAFDTWARRSSLLVRRVGERWHSFRLWRTL
jgi:multicomponent Na+:H+ antiporter subunit B